MNMKKKLMSVLVAATMTVSSFVAFATSASAADTVLYTNSFDGYTKDTGLAVPYSSQNGWQAAADGGNEYFKLLLTLPTSCDLPSAQGDTSIKLQCGTSNDDDTCAVFIREKTEGDNYIAVPRGRFGKQGNTSLTGFENITPADGEDLLISFKMMMTLNDTDRGDKAISVAFGDVGNYDYTADVEGVWQDVRVILKADGTKSVYVAGEEKLTGDSDKTVKDITVLMPSAGDKAGNGRYPLVNFDDMVIMSVAAGTGATVEVPDAVSSGDIEVTPPPTIPPLAKKSAPVLKAHSSAANLYEQNFNDVAVDTGVVMSDTAVDEYKDIDGLVLSVGARAAYNTDNYAKVTKTVTGDNSMTISGGQWSIGGRCAKVALADELSIADTENTAILGAAFQLSSSAAATGIGKLYLLDNDTNKDDNGVARDMLAVISTEEDVSGYSNGDTAIGISVTAGEWHTVVVAVSGDKYRVYIDGNYENPIVQGTKVGTGATSVPVTDLPLFTATNGKGTTYSLVNIDNIVAYQIETPFEKKYLPAVGEAPEAPEVEVVAEIKDAATVAADVESDTAAVVKATKNADGTYTAEVVTGLNAGDNTITWKTAPVAGDKIMVFQSLKSMVPSALTPYEVPAAPAAN